MSDLKNDGLSVIVPAFNEGKAVGQTIFQLKNALAMWGGKSEIVVVDDGSDDDTASVAAAHAVRVIRHPINSGYGRSLLSGIEQAQYETIVISDADGTYPLEMLPTLIDFYDQGFDMAVAARQGENYYSSTGKRLLRFIFRSLSEFTCGRTIPDINSGFRVFKRAPVLAQRGALSTGFSFTTTITLLFMLEHYFVGYMPIPYNRRVGSSKVRLWRDSLRSLQIITTAIAQFNPLKLILLLAAVDFAGSCALTLFFKYVWTLQPLSRLSVLVIFNSLCLLAGCAVVSLVQLRVASKEIPR